MTIRNRTDRSRATAQSIAGLVGVAGLAGAGALHVAWAAGSTWPARDADDLADLVTGREPQRDPDHDQEARPERSPLPGTVATVGVAGLLGTAAVLTATSAGLLPLGGGRTVQLARLGSRVAAGVLLARGVGGLAASSLGIDQASERFRRWNRRLYSPVCLGLGTAIAMATRG